jgi:hypothetical protein
MCLKPCLDDAKMPKPLLNIINSIFPKKETWSMARGEEEGAVLLFRIRNNIPPKILPEQFPNLINIYWYYEDTSNGGLPTKEILTRMQDFEGHLDSIEAAGGGFFVLSITGNQRKEWILYTHDVKQFLYRLNMRLQALPAFPIEIETNKDPSWDYYFRLIQQLKLT